MLLGQDYADIAVRAGMRTSWADRQRYRPLLAIIEEELAAASAVVAGTSAKLALLERYPPEELPALMDDKTLGTVAEYLSAFHIEAYSPRPFDQAKRIAERLKKHDPDGLTRYTVAAPRPGDVALIFVNQRELAKLTRLPMHRGTKIFDVVLPYERKGLYGGGTIKCIGPELLLIQQYMKLCDPANAGEWADLLATERDIRKMFLKESAPKLQEAVGGAPNPQALQRRFTRLLEDRFIKKLGRVVIGPRALGKEGRYQLISTYSLEQERETLKKLAEEAEVHVEFLVNDPKIPVDRRLRRLSAYIHVPGFKREALLDIYNVAEYEAVPVGTSIVVARFLLVDLWTIQLLAKMDIISQHFARNQTRLLLDYFQEASNRIDAGRDLLPKPLTNFIGQSINPDLALRREAIESGTRPRPSVYI